jgi:hypothetical protein
MSVPHIKFTTKKFQIILIQGVEKLTYSKSRVL